MSLLLPSLSLCHHCSQQQFPTSLALLHHWVKGEEMKMGSKHIPGSCTSQPPPHCLCHPHLGRTSREWAAAGSVPCARDAAARRLNLSCPLARANTELPDLPFPRRCRPVSIHQRQREQCFSRQTAAATPRSHPPPALFPALQTEGRSRGRSGGRNGAL